MRKIPYGISSFEKIKTENYYYIDKSKYIEILENYGSPYLFFLRPRRFGKSLFLSMLSYYYDINQKDNFDKLFGDTYIGKNPTTLRNTYPMLYFNFSMIKPFGSIDDIRNFFFSYIKAEIESFIEKYQSIFELTEEYIKNLLTEVDSFDLLRTFFIKLRNKNVSIFLIIDEYDNFANNILAEHGADTYMNVTHAGGFLRNFFTNLKGLTDNREIDRLFITGVSPLVMADVTSGFNIGDNISQNVELSTMIGISHNEIKEILNYYNSVGVFNIPIETIIDDFNLWYDGYSFNEELQKVYNTISVLYYINRFITEKKRPIILIDENMRTDYGKFRFLLTENNKLNGNFSVLREILDKSEITAVFIRSFAINDIIEKQKFVSLLFYLGFISFKDFSVLGTFKYSIPNKLITVLLWEFIQRSITEVYELKMDRYFLINAFSSMSEKGEWRPAFDYIIGRFYDAVSIRDFVFHEEGIKTFMLAWLNMAIYYKIYSEKELEKGFSDIYIEPEKRYGDAIKYGYIIELKYIKAEHLRSKKKAETAVQEAIKTVTEQLKQYASFSNFKTIKIIIVVSAKKLLYMSELD